MRIRKTRRQIFLFVILFLLLSLTAAFAVVWPEASGTTVFSAGNATIDASNTSDGYICIKHATTVKRIVIRVMKEDTTYQYNLTGNDQYAVLPLQMGSGTYTIRVYRQVEGNNYTQEGMRQLEVILNNNNAAYLCPNQYIWYQRDDKVVQLAKQVLSGIKDTKTMADKADTYLAQHMMYNYILALTVNSSIGNKTYLPDLNLVLSRGMGICFDISATFAAMMRVQGVECRMVVGQADQAGHAWNEVLLNGKWVRYDATAKITKMEVTTYIEERYY